jgi:lipoprotein-releasing system ATP-binding protein
MSLLKAHEVRKTYADMALPVDVLRGVDCEILEGQAVGIFGASGSGKSTLLHLLGGLDRPTSGTILAAGVDLGTLTAPELARFRNREVGFVFQFYHLLPELSALENVMLPALIAGLPRHEAERRAGEALEELGLSQRLAHLPAMLSGGEQQRVAIARAAVMRPRVLLADEPTGNLDRETGMRVWRYLLELQREHRLALVVVTHNQELLADFTHAFELRDGRLWEWASRN